MTTAQTTSNGHHGDSRKSIAPLVVGAIAVVFGDIGTSPLYTIRQCFTAGHMDITEGNVLGTLSIGSSVSMGYLADVHPRRQYVGRIACSTSP